jgi:hypothetical protein
MNIHPKFGNFMTLQALPVTTKALFMTLSALIRAAIFNLKRFLTAFGMTDSKLFEAK